MLVIAKTDIDKCGAAVIRQIHTKREGAQGVTEKGRQSLLGNAFHLTGTRSDLLHHFFMSRATGEVAPGRPA